MKNIKGDRPSWYKKAIKKQTDRFIKEGINYFLSSERKQPLKDMKTEERNLDPHRPARCAMWLYADRYTSQRGGSMDFWDKLSDSEKNTCRRMADQISTTRPESDDER